MATNEALKKTEINKVEAKPAVVILLSALLTDAKDTADAKKGNNLY
jgi:SecD/SecF fusion protein